MSHQQPVGVGDDASSGRGSTRGPSQEHNLVESPPGVGSSKCPESVRMIGTLSALMPSPDGSTPYPIHSSPLRSTAGPPTAYVRVLWDRTRPYTEQCAQSLDPPSPPSKPTLPMALPISARESLSFQSTGRKAPVSHEPALPSSQI